MEYLRGEELTETLQGHGRLPVERVAGIAEQILAALAEAHQRGVIHRDLKPSNIFLCATESGDDFVKVFDFGIAKVSGDGDLMATAKLTVSGGVMGTPVYMSPEQCRGEELTPASDFYSLGIILYELLAGRPPFDDENPVRVLLAHNHEPVPALPDAIAETPLGRAVLRALAKQPGERFATAAAFLAAIQGHESPVERPLLSADIQIPMREPDASRQQEPAQTSTRGTWPLWLLVAVLLLMVAVVVAILNR
jgi:serine/threonine-protein kinase